MMAHCRRRRQVRRQFRRGMASTVLLGMLPVLLIAVGVALQAVTLGSAASHHQLTADAVSLAAAQALVNDRQLLSDSASSPILQVVSRAQAEESLAANTGIEAENQELTLAFGSMTEIGSGQMQVLGLLTDPALPAVENLNSVQVNVNLPLPQGPVGLLGRLSSLTPTSLQLKSTAALDQAVIGFRAVRNQSIPMAPIALLSDPTGILPQSWEHQIEQRNGSDQWARDLDNSVDPLAAGTDGIPEMQVRFAAGADTSPLNARLLRLGTEDIDDVAMQVREGITTADLAELGGEMVLSPAGSLSVPGSTGELILGPGALAEALEQLRASGRPRIWPLFAGVESILGEPQVTGFVAARVASVEVSPVTGLTFTVQPAMLTTVTTVTAADRPGYVDIPMNRYLSRMRLVRVD